MLFFDSIGPNAHIVRMFMFEKGLDIPAKKIDVVSGENRQQEFLKLNPAGQVPAFQLDDGSVIAEVPAICEYLDELALSPALIGNTREERAETRMWVRRVDLMVVQPITLGFRYAEGADFFTGREPVFPEASAAMKQLAQEKLEWLNGMMEGKEFICGSRFTLADIMLFCFLSFAEQVGQSLNPNLENITSWQSRISKRASAGA